MARLAVICFSTPVSPHISSPLISTCTHSLLFLSHPMSSLAYHCKCVDPWLTKTKKTCPVCKQKVVPSQGDSDSDSDSGESSREDNEDASESTPLLRSLASTSAHSFGTMSGSPSPHGHESSDYEDDDDMDTSDESEPEEEVTVETVVVQLQQSRPDEDDEARA